MRVWMAALIALGLFMAGDVRAQGCPWAAWPCVRAEPWAAQTRDSIAAKAALARGQADFMTGNFLRSAEATGEAFRRDPANLEAAIWHVAAMARLGQYPAALVAKIRRDGTELKRWPGPVLDWFLGRLDRVALQELATDQNSSTVEDYTFSFFYFHVASVELAAGRLDMAEEALAGILDLGPGVDRQIWRAAGLELGRVIELNDSKPRQGTK